MFRQPFSKQLYIRSLSFTRIDPQQNANDVYIKISLWTMCIACALSERSVICFPLFQLVIVVAVDSVVRRILAYSKIVKRSKKIINNEHRTETEMYPYEKNIEFTLFFFTTATAQTLISCRWNTTIVNLTHYISVAFITISHRFTLTI